MLTDHYLHDLEYDDRDVLPQDCKDTFCKCRKEKHCDYDTF